MPTQEHEIYRASRLCYLRLARESESEGRDNGGAVSLKTSNISVNFRKEDAELMELCKTYSNIAQCSFSELMRVALAHYFRTPVSLGGAKEDLHEAKV